jgi:hypothetical protein
MYKDDHYTVVLGSFCNYKESGIQSPVNVLASLVLQLVYSGAGVEGDLKALHTSHMKTGTRPRLEEVSSLLRKEAERYQRIFLVVDALDEYTDKAEFKKVLLAEFPALRPSPNILVTSRYSENIATEFRCCRQLEISASHGDVQSYIMDQLASEGRLNKMMKRDPSLEGEILRVIPNKSEGIFLLV